MFHFLHSHFVYGSGDSSQYYYYDCATWFHKKNSFIKYSKRPDIVNVFKIFNPDCFCS